MMNRALVARGERFTRIWDRPGSTVIDEVPDSLLVAIMRADERLFDELSAAVIAYVDRSIPRECVDPTRTPTDLLLKHRQEIQTITPGGIIVPKRNSSLEYNAVLRAFAELVDAFGFGRHIGGWHFPPNVRVKFPDVTTQGRIRPSERPHSDAWAGEHPDSVTVHIPLFGDTDHNRLDVWLPKDDFEEAWLEPAPANDFETVQRYENEMIARWGPREGMVTRLGCCALMDASVLHGSHRDPGCGPRISIEAPFVWADAPIRQGLAREIEHQPHQWLLGAGETHYFHFPHAPGERVDSAGALKHPSAFTVTEFR